MPIIKSAKKKLRQDKKRKAINLLYKENYKKAFKAALTVSGQKAKKGTDKIKKAFSAIDKATKKGVIHKNKAARLKSHISSGKKK